MKKLLLVVCAGAALTGVYHMHSAGVERGPRRTPLMDALGAKEETQAKKLIESGAALDAKDKWGRTPLHYAVYRWFNGNGAGGINAVKSPGSGSEELVNLILDRGANIDAQDNDGNTPLMIAVISQQPDMVQLLINRGAATNIQNNKGKTALELETSTGRFGRGGKSEEDIAADATIQGILNVKPAPAAPPAPMPSAPGGPRSVSERADVKAGEDVAQQLQDCRNALAEAYKEINRLKGTAGEAEFTI